jgi:UDP-glucuronate 4-epimerase
MTQKQSTVLVTGGAGFIGSQLAARLLDSDTQVIIVDNFDSYYDPKLKRANIAALKGDVVVYEVDIRDTSAIERVFANHSIQGVVHLAAMAGVRFSVEKGPLYAEVNTVGSANLLNAARQHAIEVFIQASTSSVYGQTSKIPFSEDDAAATPLAPYPASKRAAEIFGHSYHHLFGLNVTVLRLFNVYGPHGRPDMMPLRVIESILSGQSIPVYDGGVLERDWTYIEDTVDGIVAALERPMGFEIINLGYGAATSLQKFIQIYERLIGKPAITHSIPTPLSEPHITFCNNQRARDLLGFSPRVAIEEGLQCTWEWYRSRAGI